MCEHSSTSQNVGTKADVETLKRLFAAEYATLQQSSARFDLCMDSLAVWRSWLNEHGYVRQLESVTDQGKRESLVNGQRERRFYYTGWRLASVMALSDMRITVQRYSRLQMGLEKFDRSLVDRHSVQGWIRRQQQSTGKALDSQPDSFSAAGKSYALFSDETNGRGIEAVNDMYAECLAGRQWSLGRYNAFSRSDCQPLTLVAWRDCADPMVGAHLLPLFDDLLDRQGWRGPDSWFTLMQALTDHNSRVNEPQFQARMAELQRSSSVETRLKEARLNSYQHLNRAFWHHLVEKIQTFVEDARRFYVQLSAFVELHRIKRVEANNPASAAAMFNCVAAWMLMPAVDALVKDWQKILDEKHLPIVKACRQFEQDSPMTLEYDLDRIVKDMEWGIAGSCDYLAGIYCPVTQSALEKFADELEQLIPDNETSYGVSLTRSAAKSVGELLTR